MGKIGARRGRCPKEQIREDTRTLQSGVPDNPRGCWSRLYPESPRAKCKVYQSICMGFSFFLSLYVSLIETTQRRSRSRRSPRAQGGAKTPPENPNKTQDRTIFWYRIPHRCFGFAETEVIATCTSYYDVSRPQSELRLSWVLDYQSYGGRRAGSVFLAK